MNNEKLEELFVDFILDIIGPNEIQETERNNKYFIVKKLIEDDLSKQFPEYILHILSYGSFPIKEYLKDADIDITIFLENKNTHEILIDIPGDFINNIIFEIKKVFENYNKDSRLELFSEINIIYADIRLLKCKINAISLDISVNNFSGLHKILFIDYIKKKFESKFISKNLFNIQKYKINIFRKTLLLIKAWCYYEGNLMGSNIGLMASYALEIMVIYIFNIHYEIIHNEFEGFCKFFELMEQIDWDNYLLSIFGVISQKNFHDKLLNYNNYISNHNNDKKNNDNNEILKPFYFIENNKKNTDNKNEFILNGDSDPLLDIKDLNDFVEIIKNSKGYHINENDNSGNLIKENNFEKLCNILDPINSQNNLGKSINYHSFSKMKKVFEFINKRIKKIKIIRKLNDPFLYINSLLQLFKITLSNNFIQLFINYLNAPKMFIQSKKFNTKYDLKINKDEIQKFNSIFIDKEIPNHESEEEDEDAEEDDEEEYDEEDDEYEDENHQRNSSSEGSEEKKGIKYEKYDIIINNEIINKLKEYYSKKDEISNFNDKMAEKAQEQSSLLINFLKDYKII